MPEDFDDIYEGIIRDLYRQASSEKTTERRAGNYLESADGVFLGKLTSNRFDAEGIFNEYGPYGSKYSSTSIFNEYGPYGGKFSPQSPWNQYAVSPPRIILHGQQSGVLSKNRFTPGARDPDEFLGQIRNDARYAW